MRLLALDASTKSTGWAIFDDNKLVKYGCLTNSSNNTIERILYMTAEVNKLISENGITKIIMEEVLPKNEDYDDGAKHHSNPKVFKPLMWLQGAIAICAHIHHKEIEIEYILPNSWRSKIGIKTGRGITREALKKADQKFAKDTFGIDVNDDIADACGLGWSQIKISNDSFDWS